MLNGIITLLCLLGFIGIVIWTYSDRQKARFEDAAQLPLQEEKQTRQAASSGSQS